MEQTYFQRALSDFVYDMASKGAICHLTDMGYTVKQIQERLACPTPCERIQEMVWKHLLDTGVVALTRQAETGEKVEYVREYDSYGKASFRRVTIPVTAPQPSAPRLCCRFGLLKYRTPGRYREVLEALEPGQAEYIDGLPWPLESVWHRADQRMLEICHALERAGFSQDVCFFESGEQFTK